jgi:hypothetical protein
MNDPDNQTKAIEYLFEQKILSWRQRVILLNRVKEKRHAEVSGS